MIEVKVENARAATEILYKKSPKALSAAEKEAMTKSVNDLKGRLKADAARSMFTGNFSSKIAVMRPTKTQDIFIGKVGSTSTHGPWVEHGRGPGRFPNIDAIRNWVMRKTGNEDATYIIARSIAQKGTLKNRRQGYDSGWAHIRAVTKERTKEIQRIWHEVVERYIRQV